METINEKIKRLRKLSGISQVEVATSASITQSSYASIEKGDTKSISIEVGKGIAKAIGISFNELFDVEPSKENSEQIDLLSAENEDLKEKFEEKLQLLEMLKKEKEQFKFFLLFHTFIEYSKDMVDINKEIMNTEIEEERLRLENKKNDVAEKFTSFKNTLIQSSYFTQMDFVSHSISMRSWYDFLPEEFN
jgi:transcriptional regulator with XRE-family HTH domain